MLGGITTSVSTFPAANVDLNAILPVSRVSASGSQPGFDVRDALNTDPLVGWAPPTGSTEPQRITLTRSMLDTARSAILVAAGEAKRAAVERLLAGDPALPAQGLPGLTVVTDLDPRVVT